MSNGSQDAGMIHGLSIIRNNWRTILLGLLAANLVFMALLELQRRAIWDHQQAYVYQAVNAISDKTGTNCSRMTKELSDFNLRLADIDSRVNDVESAVREVPGNVEITKDIQTHVTLLHQAIEQLAPAK